MTVWEGKARLGYLALRCTRERFLGASHDKLELLATRGVDAPRLVCRPDDEARCAAAIYRHLLARGLAWSMVELRQQYDVSRSVRQLLGKGELEHVSSDDPAVTPALLELYATIAPRSWKKRTGEAFGRHQEQTAFFRRLLAPHQPMRISVELVLLDKVPSPA